MENENIISSILFSANALIPFENKTLTSTTIHNNALLYALNIPEYSLSNACDQPIYKATNFNTSKNDNDLNSYQVKMLSNELFIINKIESNSELLKSLEVTPPNKNVINKSIYFLRKLANFNIFTSNIATNVEEGISFVFSQNKMNFYFELYNSGEMAFAIENIHEKQVSQYGMIASIDDAVKKINEFIII